MRSVVKMYYRELRPGHPHDYPIVHVALRSYLDAFPKSVDQAILIFYLAEASAVIVSNWPYRNKAPPIDPQFSTWRNIAELYNQAAQLDLLGVTKIPGWRGKKIVRESALQGEAVSLINALDVYEATPSQLNLLLKKLERYVLTSNDENYHIRGRIEFIKALVSPLPRRLSLLWKFIDTSNSRIKDVAIDSFVKVLPLLDEPERIDWTNRLLKSSDVHLEKEFNACIQSLEKTGTPCKPEYKPHPLWIENPLNIYY